MAMLKLNRRQLLTASLASLIGLSQSVRRSLAKPETVLKPPRLKDGAGVGLISPAGATFVGEELEIVKDAVKALGLTPYLAPHLLARYGYLGGSDENRAKDVNQFFGDAKIALLLPLRGGWGSARILPYLDYEVIGQNPKIILGFSDLTALILAIYAKTGLVTFHGLNGLTSWRPGQVDGFRRILFAGEKITFRNQVDGDDGDRLMQVKNRIRTITDGKARGRLMGGNLSVISAMVGSSYLPDFKGAILFVEDVGENIYRIDRLLTHLKLAGILQDLHGFIFGQCINCLPNGDYGSLTLEEVLLDHVQPLGIPAYSGAQIGHIENIPTLPLGIMVEIDATSGTISMLETAVVDSFS
jgi:muramoyltetrapeptide carboxypeptidase